jgi:hypothetical protein
MPPSSSTYNPPLSSTVSGWLPAPGAWSNLTNKFSGILSKFKGNTTSTTYGGKRKTKRRRNNKKKTKRRR